MLDFNFQPVSARRFLTIDSHVSSGEENPTGRVVSDITRQDVVGAVVRLRITVPSELEGMLRDGEIRRALGEAHYVAAITHEVERDRRTRIAPGVAEGLTCMDALRIYIESRGLDNDRRDKLMEYALGLIDTDELVENS